MKLKAFFKRIADPLGLVDKAEKALEPKMETAPPTGTIAPSALSVPQNPNAAATSAFVSPNPSSSGASSVTPAQASAVASAGEQQKTFLIAAIGIAAALFFLLKKG